MATIAHFLNIPAGHFCLFSAAPAHAMQPGHMAALPPTLAATAALALPAGVALDVGPQTGNPVVVMQASRRHMRIHHMHICQMHGSICDLGIATTCATIRQKDLVCAWPIKPWATKLNAPPASSQPVLHQQNAMLERCAPMGCE